MTMNAHQLDRTSPSWPITFALSYFDLPSSVFPLIQGFDGSKRLNRLWGDHGVDLYHSPLFALRQEWFHSHENSRFRAAVLEDLRALAGQNKSLLDYGCGTAEFCRRAWIERGNKTTLMDIAGPNFGYVKAKMNIPEAQVEYREVEQGLPDQQFDIVICLDVLEHISDPVGVCTSLWERVKPGGFAFFAFSQMRNHAGHLDAAIDEYPAYNRWVKTVPQIIHREGVNDLFRKPVSATGWMRSRWEGLCRWML